MTPQEQKEMFNKWARTYQPWLLEDPEDDASRLLKITAVSAWEAASEITGWQPIDTAPKDGTEILGWIVSNGSELSDPFARASLIHWREAFKSSIVDRRAGWDKQWIGEVTHWMPLPPAP